MKCLNIINEAPYGTEKGYNALRLAMQIQKDFPENEVFQTVRPLPPGKVRS